MPKYKYIIRREFDHWLIFDKENWEVKKESTCPYFDSNIARFVDNNISVPGVYSAPLKLFIDLSDFCNLKCTHCLSSSSPKGSKSLTTSDINRLVKEAANIGVFIIKLGGGEPLLYPNITDIINNISNSGIGISLTTNGTAFSENHAKVFINNHVKVSFSIDGTKSIHEAIRGKGTYGAVIKAAVWAKRLGVNANLQYTMMKSNVNCMSDIIELSKDLDIPLKVRRVKPSGRSIDNFLVFMKYDKEYWEAVQLLQASNIKDIEDIMNTDSNVNTDMLCGSNDCGAGTRSMHVANDGSISPCIFLGSDFVDGNINAKNLHEVWENGRAHQAIRTRKENETCSTCLRRDSCHSECPAITLISTGNISGDDPGCPIKLSNIYDLD